MVQIRLERYPPGTIKKLHARSARSFKILRKINSNTYVVGPHLILVFVPPLMLKIWFSIKVQNFLLIIFY